jgi:hypothetical protein
MSNKLRIEGFSDAKGEFRYPAPAADGESMYKLWKPISGMDLNQADIINFDLKLAPGELAR